MADFLFRLALESDGLVIGFAAGAILACVMVAPIAYEAGRRRMRREALEEARTELWRDPTEVPGWPLNDRSVVPSWPPGPA